MKRIPIFDIAKALLVLSVFWGHVPQIYTGWYHGVNATITAIDVANIKLIAPFFMVAFFVISGYFLNTKKSLWESTKSDLLTLVLPTIVLSIISNGLYGIYPCNFVSRFHQYLTLEYWAIGFGYWFLTALFINKFITQILVRYVKNISVLIIITMCFCVLGLLLKTKFIAVPNCLFYKEALLMCPMTLIGYFCKKYDIEVNRSSLQYLALGYVITTAILWVTDSNMSGFNLGTAFSVDYIPMALWLGVSGTAFVLYISSWLERSRLLNLMGQLTLPMFCFNFLFIEIFLIQFVSLVNNGYAFLYVVSVFVCSSLSAFVVSIILNTKYLRWTLGKFKKEK